MLERMIMVGLCALAFVIMGAQMLKVSDCAGDDKLIGRVALSSEPSSSTLWTLTRAELKQRGIDVDDPEAVLEVVNAWLGTEFTRLQPAIDALVESTRAFDLNGNGFVCAYDVRSARRNSGDPFTRHYALGVSDDKGTTLTGTPRP
jgi:hypothetical protein